MKKVAAITFHHAHNFGSVLQAYALQEFVTQLDKDIEYEIIDFYTEKQEELYKVYRSERNIKSIIKNLIALPYGKKMKIKHQRFEEFLSEECNLTCRYKTEEELIKNAPIEDVYISGSDQIWNVRAVDFSRVYYLGFVKKGKKISYAASFGPLEINWNQYNSHEYAKWLNDYEGISVREQGSAENIFKLTGKKAKIHVDPTLLLSKEQWRGVQSNANYNNGKYILLYCLEPTKKQLKMANMISKKLKLPILVLKYNNKNDMFNRFIKRYDAGPKDFLSYIDNAALVLSSSFHGTIFSLLYNKAFYVFDGMKDNRISTILEKTRMEKRSISNIEDIRSINLQIPNYTKINHFLEKERKDSEEYLRSAIMRDESYRTLE